VGIEGTSAPERGTAQALKGRRPDRSESPSPDGAPGRLLLSLQDTAGNRAVSGLVQRLRVVAGVPAGTVQRDASYTSKKALATVHDSGNPITAEGTAVDAAGNTGELKGALSYFETSVPGEAVGSSIGLQPPALEIKAIDAKPRGTALGNILMWHLARKALAEKIDYVVAGNVTDARGPFYGPLGFLDYKNARKHADLKAEENQLRQQMSGPGPVPPESGARLNEVVHAIAENRIFANAAELEENARAKWSARWKGD
jgi:hypothetical protein